MSRSYRRPYAAITGVAGAKWDKQMAHRGVRRGQVLALKTCLDYENLLLPHPLECTWNNNYCWGRDGAQSYRTPPRDRCDDSCLKYYRKLLRK